VSDNRIFIYLPGSTSLVQNLAETDVRAVTEVLDKTRNDDETLLCHVEGGLIYAAAGQVKRVLTRYIHTHIYIYVYTHTHTHTLNQSAINVIIVCVVNALLVCVPVRFTDACL
jgi:hypothetical protein